MRLLELGQRFLDAVQGLAAFLMLIFEIVQLALQPLEALGVGVLQAHLLAFQPLAPLIELCEQAFGVLRSGRFDLNRLLVARRLLLQLVDLGTRGSRTSFGIRLASFMVDMTSPFAMAEAA